MFLDRRRRAGPWLEWKVRLFVVAAVLGLAGIYLEARWLTGAAIGVLAAGLLLRIMPSGVQETEADPGIPEDEARGEGS